MLANSAKTFHSKFAVHLASLRNTHQAAWREKIGICVVSTEHRRLATFKQIRSSKGDCRNAVC